MQRSLLSCFCSLFIEQSNTSIMLGLLIKGCVHNAYIETSWLYLAGQCYYKGCFYCLVETKHFTVTRCCFLSCYLPSEGKIHILRWPTQPSTPKRWNYTWEPVYYEQKAWPCDSRWKKTRNTIFGLTVPLEVNIETAYTQKQEKYPPLTKDISEKK